MPRPYEFPDPKDQSVNKPSFLVDRAAVLALYNQANPSNPYENISETVREWFEGEAKKQGWSSVAFVNQSAVLTAKVNLG